MPLHDTPLARYVTLGRSGLRVSPFCLGTMTFGEDWGWGTPVDETMSALDALVHAGKVRYLGISDSPAWCVAEAQLVARQSGWTPFIALQVEYNLLERTVEGELILLNTLEHSPRGIPVVIDIVRQVFPDLRMRALVTVADEGPGIAPDLLPRIFEP